MNDIQIAQAARIEPIAEVAARAGIPGDALIAYGKYKAKVDVGALGALPERGKMILVTAINPTPAGEGKTTVSIGLADALNRTGRRAVLALREPSLGPVFGVKGGATGGGYAQVLPMEDINLHFTGDLHAITCANNLLAAMIDNHIYQGNALRIDPRRVVWRRCMDMNDRQLREVISGLGGKAQGMPRADGFDITAASEVMAVLCLARDIPDLKLRLARMLVGYTFDGAPVRAGELNAQGAMAALLRDAMMPNLVQTIEGTPTFVHGGPFANIAHGCNSLVATRLALGLSEYVVTEAGFGADLGAEKFLDIKCRMGGIAPRCAVVVATVRALKCHGGVKKEALGAENVPALKRGLPNLLRHIGNMRDVFGLPVTVALNRFSSDTQAELDAVLAAVSDAGASAHLCEVWASGGAGAISLAEEVARLCESPSQLTHPYSLGMPLSEKIEALCTRVYGAEGVEFAQGVRTQLKAYENMGYQDCPVCMAKTQYSLSDDAKRLGAPKGFTVHVRAVRMSAGAGFVVALAGDIMTMPGLPKQPAAEQVDVDETGKIEGIF